jgi:hypothetical protein
MSLEQGSSDADAPGPTPTTSQSTPTSTPKSTPKSTLSQDSPLVGLLIIGSVLVAVGLVAGFILATRVVPDGCDEDVSSCAHPHAIVGLILVGASAFAGVMLAITNVIARHVINLSSRGTRPE